MGRFIDLIGCKFGRLTVISKHSISKNGSINWLCRCNCGIEKVIRGDGLKSGLIKSCGCLRKEKTTTHGLAYNLIYSIYDGMVQRCTNINATGYKDYGGRGITVCRRWLNKKTGFKNFLFDMGERPGARYSIDRINNSKGYYKSNCRWSTGKEQCRNTRKNIMITYNGKTQCLAAWAEKYKINYQTLYSRLYESNWSIEKALIIPVKHKKL